jgi:hypothetical protein
VISGNKVSPVMAQAEFLIKVLRDILSDGFISNLFVTKLKRIEMNSVYGLSQDLYDLLE